MMFASIKEHQRVIDSMRDQVGLLDKMASQIIRAFKANGKLYLLGNGGSAADAQHIAAELIGRFKRDRRPLPAIALTTDTSILTAITNDFSGKTMFSRQVEALVTTSDIVWALSVSGSSPNVLEGMKAAYEQGAISLGFTGSQGHQLKKLCDICFMVDHADSDRVQEAHQLAYHCICEKIEEQFV